MSTSALPMPARVATSTDVDAMAATLTTAFFDDPLWGPAFPDRERRAGQASAFWRFFVTSSLRYHWTLVTEKVESVAVWIPPGGVELTDEEHRGFEAFLIGITSRPVAERIVAISDQLEAARPSEPHFYLTLLGTHEDHRGAGHGMRLLREGISRIDALGAAAYLESSNPANNRRYESVGFSRRAELSTPSGHVVTTMWRRPRP
jgi:ribosomal protein S18 acetylase RimI-like enzyme